MRRWIAFGLVASFAVAAFAYPEPEPTRSPARFLEILTVGDRVARLSNDSGYAFAATEGYSLTIVTEEELAKLRLTPAEEEEYAGLRDLPQRFPSPVRDPNVSNEEFMRGMKQALQERQEKSARRMELRRKADTRDYTVVAVGGDYVGLKDGDGRTAYVPERRIAMIAVGVPPLEPTEAASTVPAQ